MNKKIHQMAKKCWSHTINGTLIDGHLHFDYEKFAQMIVNECAGVADNTVIGTDKVGEAIRKHFE